MLPDVCKVVSASIATRLFFSQFARVVVVWVWIWRVGRRLEVQWFNLLWYTDSVGYFSVTNCHKAVNKLVYYGRYWERAPRPPIMKVGAEPSHPSTATSHQPPSRINNNRDNR
eukprot:scaffold39081_cov55-Cyclotella_meneghiniana.AAC.1